jgi:propionyl-CoA synthetase
VAECAVIGIHDELKGQRPRGFVVLKAGSDIDDTTLQAELIQLVRDQIGPVAAFRDIDIVLLCPRPGPARSCARQCAA